MGHRAPRAPARFEQEIQKSRFIGIAVPAATPEEVEASLQQIGREFPDATHRCWAYVLGNPDAGPKMRCDDAGEPAGTAGKPILNVLQRRGIGDVLVVVVRYFGGVKLGAGGLVRAYSGTAGRLMDELELTTTTPRVALHVRLDYADESMARRVLARLGIAIASVSYGEDVVVTVEASEEESEALMRELGERTGGRATVRPSSDAI